MSKNENVTERYLRKLAILSMINFVILPPLKFIVFLVSIVPVLWLFFCGKEEFALDVLADILAFKV